MIKLYNFDELRPEEILNRDIRAEKNVEDVVDGIIADVRARGDAALKDYALKFDGAALESVPKGQLEAGQCVGMTYMQIMRRIILPQALRTAFPTLANSLIAMEEIVAPQNS